MSLDYPRDPRGAIEPDSLTFAPRCAAAALLTWLWRVSRFLVVFSTSSLLDCRFALERIHECHLSRVECDWNYWLLQRLPELCLAGLDMKWADADIRHCSQNLIIGIYMIVFGLAIALLGVFHDLYPFAPSRKAILTTAVEFQVPPQVSRYANFLFSFIGRGVCMLQYLALIPPTGLPAYEFNSLHPHRRPSPWRQAH